MRLKRKRVGRLQAGVVTPPTPLSGWMTLQCKHIFFACAGAKHVLTHTAHQKAGYQYSYDFITERIDPTHHFFFRGRAAHWAT